MSEIVADANLAMVAGSESENSAQKRGGTATRRRFVGGSVLATAAAVSSHLMARHGIAATAAKYPAELYSGENRRFFQEIMLDENVHANFLGSALGTAAVPKPTFKNLQAANIVQFISMSVAFENTGSRAYPSAAPFLLNPGYLSLAARLGGVEAYHSGYLNALANLPTLIPDGTPFLFLQPLTPQGIVSDLTPFIASLNGGPTPNFQVGVRSDANDVAILNFAYVLELLEQQFYNTNVPIYFP